MLGRNPEQSLHPSGLKSAWPGQHAGNDDELHRPGERIYLHNLDGSAWNAQMRVIFEQLRCRFVGVRLHDCIEHDIVPDTAAALSSDAPRLPDSGTLVDEYVGVLVHPISPVLTHLFFGRLPLFRIGFLPVVDDGTGREIDDKKPFHGRKHSFVVASACAKPGEDDGGIKAGSILELDGLEG